MLQKLLAIGTKIGSGVLLFIGCTFGQSKTLDEELQTLLRFDVDTITPTQLYHSSTPLLLLDCREKEEFDVSHIPEAHWLGYTTADIDAFAKKNSTDTPIIVYCSVGYRSENIGRRLTAKGFRVKNLYGGIFAWKNNGFQVVDTFNTTEKVHTYNEKWGQWLTKGEKVYGVRK